eukprot:scpid73549/ scgid31131/ 
MAAMGGPLDYQRSGAGALHSSGPSTGHLPSMLAGMKVKSTQQLHIPASAAAATQPSDFAQPPPSLSHTQTAHSTHLLSGGAASFPSSPAAIVPTPPPPAAGQTFARQDSAQDTTPPPLLPWSNRGDGGGGGAIVTAAGMLSSAADTILPEMPHGLQDMTSDAAHIIGSHAFQHQSPRQHQYSSSSGSTGLVPLSPSQHNQQQRHQQQQLRHSAAMASSFEHTPLASPGLATQSMQFNRSASLGDRSASSSAAFPPASAATLNAGEGVGSAAAGGFPAASPSATALAASSIDTALVSAGT